MIGKIVTSIGFTIVIIALVALCLFYPVRCAGNLLGKNGTVAADEARIWAEHLHMRVQAIECARMDTDGDGYVGCAVMTADEGAYMVECSGWLTLNRGCRLPKAPR